MTTPDHTRPCPSCSTVVAADAMFCPECGALSGQPTGAADHCSSCSRSISPDERFCGWCGAAQHTGEGARRPPEGRSRHDDLTDAEVTLGKYLPPSGAMGHGPSQFPAGDQGRTPSGATPPGGRGRTGDSGGWSSSQPGSTSAGARRSTALPALLVVAGLAVIALVTSVIVLLGGDSDDPDPAAIDDPATSAAPDDTSGPRARATPDRTRPTPTEEDARPLPGMTVPYTNLDCTTGNQFAVIIATGAEYEDPPPAEKLNGRIDEYGQPAAYQSAGSACPNAFNQATPYGTVYQAYLGPFTSLGAACSSWFLTSPGAFIKNVKQGAPAEGSSFCFCRNKDLPTLSPGSDRPFLVADAQQILDIELDPPERVIDGVFGDTTETNLLSYQSERGLNSSGLLDQDTWTAMKNDAGCT